MSILLPLQVLPGEGWKFIEKKVSGHYWKRIKKLLTQASTEGCAGGLRGTGWCYCTCEVGVIKKWFRELLSSDLFF